MGKYSDVRTKAYTEKNRRHTSSCLYCNLPANTREHVPSKVFLNDPFPDNLSIVPACIACNNGFSEDELYTACMVDFFRHTFFCKQISLREKTLKAIEHDDKLAKAFKEGFNVNDNILTVNYDEDRVKRILLKLSKGHIATKMDVNVDALEKLLSCVIKFKPNIDRSELAEFEKVPMVDIIGEIGSDLTHDILVIENKTTNDKLSVVLWQIVQDGNYRYLVFPNMQNGYTVRIVILEVLFAEIIYES